MKRLLTAFCAIVLVPGVACANDYYGMSTDEGLTYEYYAPDAMSVENVVPTKSGADAAAARDNYVGLRLHKNERMAFNFSVNEDTKTTGRQDNFGVGVYVGNKLTDYVRVEFETAYNGVDFKRRGGDFDYYVWSNMLNMYLVHEFDGVVSPYVGVGFGLSAMWADVNYAGIGASDFDCDLSYQAMFGVIFALNNRIDLNVGVKYQNYGRITHDAPRDLRASTRVDATEIYFGAAYKFSIDELR